MSEIHPLNELQTTNRSLNRAQSEEFAFRLHKGDILVCNLTYEHPSEHEYRITVRRGVPVDCTCPAEAYYAPACKHRIAVAIRDAVLESAIRMQAVTDGGPKMSVLTERERLADDTEGRPGDCDCNGLPDGVPCWPCYRDGHAMFDD